MSDEMSGIISSHQAEEASQPKIYGAWATVGIGVAIGLITLIAVPLLVIVGFLLVGIATGRSIVGDELAVVLSTIVAGLIGIPLIYLIVRLNGNSSMRSVTEYVRLRRLSWKIILLGLATFIIMFVSVMGVSLLYGYFIGSSGVVDPGTGEDSLSLVGWLMAAVASVIVAPVFEEFLFRGFLFAGLRRSHLGVIGTIVFTALIWALAHQQYDWFGMFKIGVMGIVLGVAYYKTDSLWCPIIVHAMWNGLAMFAIMP